MWSLNLQNLRMLLQGNLVKRSALNPFWLVSLYEENTHRQRLEEETGEGGRDWIYATTRQGIPTAAEGRRGKEGSILILNFWPPALCENTFLPFCAIPFMELCYSSPRTPTYPPTTITALAPSVTFTAAIVITSTWNSNVLYTGCLHSLECQFSESRSFFDFKAEPGICSTCSRNILCNKWMILRMIIR